jgi:hypothetical protein
MTTWLFVDKDGVQWKVSSAGMTRQFVTLPTPHGRLWRVWQVIKRAWKAVKP